MNSVRSFFIVATLAAPLVVSHAQAQAYPQRPVRIVVNVTAGGGVDALARIAGQHFTQVWGQPFVVDNRVGAGGSIGVELVTKAAPDGYTLLVTSSGVVTNAALRPQSYDPVRDLQPISRLTSNPYIVILTPSLPVANIKELIALAKSKSGGISYASAGIGSIVHMGAELLTVMAGVPMTHIPYKGVADAYPAVAAGQADWMIGSPISALPLIRGGRLKAIAVTSKVRAKALPDVPTVAESGIPGYDVVAWFGMLAPAHTPPAIVNVLAAEARKSLQTPEVARRMEIEGTDVVGNSPQEFAKEVKVEYDKWLSLVKKTGMKF
ncbi:MAG TPA: tripartite tricarboxylate transporter substrate binding protein [Burkholderiales bacterium]|jgi:tripartite-type tricarboxylate transporter receptor subunit TctC|nr:tripartite tricarboxylate transporter substrate binding protein [Burkholderiales bacterium]